MSVETWKSEFYQKSAVDTSPEEAITHSLTKWEGLRPENLQKHSVIITNTGHVGSHVDDEYQIFWVDSESCSLCHHYLGIGLGENRCIKCPLQILRGGVSCDNLTDEESEEGNNSPWYTYAHSENKNPEQMIFWLKKAQVQFAETKYDEQN